MVGGFLARALAILAMLGIGGVANACSTSSTYRSVILNSVPDTIPHDATTFHIRFEEALFDAKRGEIEGVRGVLLEEVAGLSVGSRVEITGRLGSMCNTWYEVWSDDHDIKDGILSGYVVGRRAEAESNTIRVEPVLFRSMAHRQERLDKGSVITDSWTLPRDPRRMMPDPAATWKRLRLDGDKLARNLAETNRLIREDIDRRAND